MDRPSRPPLAPRLVLVVAVLACLFGWGHGVASAAGATDGASRPGATVEQTLEAGHDHAAAGHVEDRQPSDGHAGHGAGHDHSVFCMASSAGAALGAVAAPDAAGPVITALPAQTRSLEAAPPVEAHRAPSIAALCVLRT